MSLQLVSLPEEICMDVILQLPPRHVYKLVQTNQRFCRLCLSEEYWERVATYIAWSLTAHVDCIDTVLLRKSYRATVDEYIQYIRDDIRSRNPPSSDTAELPLMSLATLGDQEIWEDVATPRPRPFTPCANAFSLAKKLVEDTDNLEKSIERATEGWDRPRRAGFITKSRRARRVINSFLRSLEDDQGMDLDTKIRVRRYAYELIRDICRRRGRSQRDPNNGHLFFELHAEDIDTTDILLERL